MDRPKLMFSRSELANNTHQVATVFAKYALALKEHEDSKSDPTKNVATGQALYAAECRLRQLAMDNATHFPEQLQNIVPALDRALAHWSHGD